MFRRRPGRLLNAICTFSWRLLSRGGVAMPFPRKLIENLENYCDNLLCKIDNYKNSSPMNTKIRIQK